MEFINQWPSRWSRIIILDDQGKESMVYPLDEKAKLMVKMKRQPRRNLDKMTGKDGLCFQMKGEQNAMRFGQIQQEQNFNNTYSDLNHQDRVIPPDDLTSISWLLNPGAVLPITN